MAIAPLTRFTIGSTALCLALLSSTGIPAQTTTPNDSMTGHGMEHGMQHDMEHDMEHGMNHGVNTGMAPIGTDASDAMPVREPGQSAFAAIGEIVALLMDDPATDWQSVDIDALRAHLIDMDNVTLHAQVSPSAIDGGIRFDIVGDSPAVIDSIQAMTLAHAATMNGVNDWQMQAETRENGAVLSVTGPDDALPTLRALGFFGLLTVGMHHQAHHLAIARGLSPHAH